MFSHLVEFNGMATSARFRCQVVALLFIIRLSERLTCHRDVTASHDPRQGCDLILRTRLFLERAHRGEIERGVINHLAQVCIIGGYIARAGHGRIPHERFRNG